MTYEFGSTAVAGLPKAEGGYLLSGEDNKWGAYLVHQSPYQNGLRSIGTYQRQDNTIDVFFGKTIGLQVFLFHLLKTKTQAQNKQP